MKAETIKKILNKGTCNTKELSSLFWELFDIADNPLENQNYTYIIGDLTNYEIKITKGVNFLCQNILTDAKFLRCKNYHDDDVIKDEVGVLNHIGLIELINAYDWNFFILIDYEAPDDVIGMDYFLDLFDAWHIGEIIFELEQEDIDKMIKFLNELDLFDWSDLNE